MSDQAVVSTRLIGEIFVERGIVTREQLDEALALQAANGGLLGEILVSSFGVSRLELATVLAEQWRAVDASGVSEPAPPASTSEPAVVAHPSPEPQVDAERRPLGEIFVASGAVSEAELARALETQRETGEKLGEILVAQGVIGRLELASALAEQWSELQVIRPPMPKEPEPWQETAVRDAAGQSTAEAEGSAPARGEIDRLTSAVHHLEDQVAELAHRQLPDIDAVRSEASAVARRLEAIEHRVDHSAAGEALDALAASVAELRTALNERIDALAGEAGPALADRLAALEAAMVDRAALDEMASRFDVLARGAARREDVDAIRDALERDLAGVRQALAERLHDDEGERLAGIESALADLSRRVEAELAERDAQIGRGAPPPEDGAVRELDERLVILQARLDEALAGRRDVEHVEEELRNDLQRVRATIDELARRIEAQASVDVESRLGEVASRAEVAALAGDVRQRLDGLEAALAIGQPTGASEEVESKIAELGGSLEGLSRRLDDLARSAEVAARPAEVEQRVSALEHALGEADARATTGLGVLHEQLESRLAEAASRAELGEAWQRIVGVEGRLEEIGAGLDAGTAGGVHRDVLDGEIAAGLSQSSAELSALLDARIAEVSTRLAEVASRAELAGLAGELGTRVGTIEGMTTQLGARLDDELASLQSRVAGELGGLHGRLAELVPRAELGEAWERIVGAEGRLAEIGATLDAGRADSVRREELDRRLHEQAAMSSAELSGMLDARVAEAMSRLTGVEQALVGAETRSTAAVEALRQDVVARLEQTVQRGEHLALETGLVERVDVRMGEIAGATNARLEALTAELHEATTMLHGRIDEIAAGLGHTGGRLAAVEQSQPAPGLVDALAARIEEAHHRVETELAASEERAHATERAIRKGLAGLGERLVASEQAYLEAGSTLRRSIERLGAAVVEADARIAGEPLDPPAAGYVAFVPTADGYRLTALDGPVPELGAIVEVDGQEGTHRAARITRSPLPLDRRRCVYLERVV